MAEKNAGAIIVAAGNSARMDGEDKMLTLLGGKPLIAYTVAAFEKCEAISAIVLVVNENNREAIATMSGEMGWRKTMPLVLGGARRQDSVRNGLSALPSECEWVVVHDGARPFVTPEIIERGLVAAEETGAACAVIPAYTSDLRVELDGRTVEVPRRIESALIQTPQVFLSSILKNAHAKVTDDVLNDAAMVGRIGVEVVTFNGARSNIKVTAQDDLAMAYGGLLGEFEDMVNRIIYSNGLIGWVENESRSDIGMSHSKEFRVIEIGLEQMHNSLRRIDPGKIEGLNYAQILLAISGFHSLSPQP